MSKPTQAGKSGRNSKLEETGQGKNTGRTAAASGNKQSAGSGNKGASESKSRQSAKQK